MRKEPIDHVIRKFTSIEGRGARSRATRFTSTRWTCPGCRNNISVESQSNIATASKRFLSDRSIIGHSPMAPISVSSYNILNPDSKEIPTEKDVEIAGNIFQTVSNKREKLAEMKVEVLANNIASLDDAATAEQKLDLWLADGLSAISNTVDTKCITASTVDQATDSTSYAILHNLVTYCNGKQNQWNDLNQLQWNEYLSDVSKQIDYELSKIPPDRCLRGVRDFFDLTIVTNFKDDDKELLNTTALDTEQAKLNVTTNTSFEESVIRYRLIQTKAAVENLRDHWKKLTTLTDLDIDRAAVKGIAVEEIKTLSKSKLNAVLQSYLVGTCQDRFDALWDLMDKDNDGLIEEEEMVTVVHMAIEPVGNAVLNLLQEAVDSYPVRAPILDVVDLYKLDATPKTPSRKEKNITKRLINTFKQTMKVHFTNELELAHRLRCTYAWANKSHQNNRIDSILVDETGWSGRKRYVELKPKISLTEFREVQKEHIKPLDRIAVEYLKSFREDLLFQQGRGRQNRELQRDCFLFMATVCLFDYIITIL